MTKQAIFLAQGLPFLQGAGVTTSATAQVLCILVVRHACFSRSILSSTILPHTTGLVQISPYQPSYCLSADHMFRPPIGLALGGAWGFREGAGRQLAVTNARLRINSILNSVTRRGTFLGNSAGVLGMIHPVLFLFVFSSAPSSLQLWDTMESIPPLMRFGVNMTRLEVW